MSLLHQPPSSPPAEVSDFISPGEKRPSFFIHFPIIGVWQLNLLAKFYIDLKNIKNWRVFFSQVDRFLDCLDTLVISNFPILEIFILECCIYIIVNHSYPQLFHCPASPKSFYNYYIISIYAYTFIYILLSPYSLVPMYICLGVNTRDWSWFSFPQHPVTSF